MKIPASFKLKGKLINVLWQEGDVCGDAYAVWDPNSLSITLSMSMSEKLREEKFLHEVIHAISDLYGLKISERQVEGLDGPLMRLLRKFNE